MGKTVALIGYPLKHSISSLFQQAAFDYYRLDVRYEAWEIEPPQLEGTTHRLRHPSLLGANITIPYKEAVLPLLDGVDEFALRIGAVNTIVNDKDKLLGYNTDAPAFLRALTEEGGFEPKGKRVAMLGAGGVAKAASFALINSGIEALTIFNRTFERGERLVASLREEAPHIKLMALKWDALVEALSHCHLLVNCTSLGMKHSPTESQSPLKAREIPKDILVYDLVYNPPETPLLREARVAGAGTLSGLFMLVYQGAASFELWVGKKAPLDIMLAKASEALKS